MGSIIAAFSVTVIFVAALAGWVMNIATVFASFDFMAGGEAIIRIAGIFIPFIGAVVGWL